MAARDAPTNPVRPDYFDTLVAALPVQESTLLRHALAARGRVLHDRSGEPLGTISAVLIDRETGRPTWLALERASRGHSLVGVPVAGLEAYGAHYQVPVPADRIHSAPEVSLAGLRASVERELCHHYGVALTRGAAWPADRRATSSRVFLGPGPAGQVGWLPAPRSG